MAWCKLCVYQHICYQNFVILGNFSKRQVTMLNILNTQTSRKHMSFVASLIVLYVRSGTLASFCTIWIPPPWFQFVQLEMCSVATRFHRSAFSNAIIGKFDFTGKQFHHVNVQLHYAVMSDNTVNVNGTCVKNH